MAHKRIMIQGTCVQYPGLQGSGTLGDASTPGTPAGSIAASAHGGTYSHAAVAGRMWGGERGAAAATAVAADKRIVTVQSICVFMAGVRHKSSTLFQSEITRDRGPEALVDTLGAIHL